MILADQNDAASGGWKSPELHAWVRYYYEGFYTGVAPDYPQRERIQTLH